MTATTSPTLADARALDAADPLGGFRDRFLPINDPGVVAYLDGNSLGRPPASTLDRLTQLVRDGWGTRLIRGWTEGWMELPARVGDELGAAALGAAPGQVMLGESTTVWLYKLLRAAVAARPDRHEIVTDVHNFPTDRYVVEAVARETGRVVRWLEPDPDGGVTVDQLRAVLGSDTAVVTLSHVAYQSAYLADLPALTRATHEVGSLVLWDLCHSVGAVPLALDADEVDLAVGCTYKFLNAGPGAPAFCYVRREVADELSQPIWGWIGREDPFGMAAGYQRGAGLAHFRSGTPPILGLVGVAEGVRLVAEAGIDGIRAKGVALTELAIALADAWLAPHAVQLGSPRDAARRGAHITLRRADAGELSPRLIEAGVLIDFRTPDGIRVGLSPLTTGFAELWRAMSVIREVVAG